MVSFYRRFCPSCPRDVRRGRRGHWAWLCHRCRRHSRLRRSPAPRRLLAEGPARALRFLAYAATLFAFGLAEHLWLGCVLIALVGAADAVTVTVRHSTVMLTTRTYARPGLCPQDPTRKQPIIWVRSDWLLRRMARRAGKHASRRRARPRSDPDHCSALGAHSPLSFRLRRRYVPLA